LPMRRDSAQGHAVVIGQDPLPPVAQLGPLHSASPLPWRPHELPGAPAHSGWTSHSTAGHRLWLREGPLLEFPNQRKAAQPV
jgi:hypothetical protein